MRRLLLLLCTFGACAVDERRADQAITNATTDTGDPAVVALVDQLGTVACTATVIGPHTAITAAHCFINRSPRTLRVFFGTSVTGDGTFSAIADARSHGSFDSLTLAHDVAMLTFRDDSPATPLGLDPRTIDASLVGTSFTVVGFGTTGSTGESGEKRIGTARVSAVMADELTAMPNPSQPCRGDSGGPALLTPDLIAGVVSRGDGACTDHAIYARIDAARAALVDPYLADTAPGTAHTGDECFYQGHCAEGACLQTHDDPLLWFCSKTCSRDEDCPAAMECASDGCRYPEPSPGALGSSCADDLQCTSELCRQSVCTLSCMLDPAVCPDGFECSGTPPAQYCLVKTDDDCGSCTTGSSAPLWLVIVWFVRARRRGRSRRLTTSNRGRCRAARSS